MTDEERLSRGLSAQNEWRELEAAFAEVEAAILKTLGETPIGQEAKVLNLHKSVQNLAAVKHALQLVISDGMIAASALGVAGLTRN